MGGLLRKLLAYICKPIYKFIPNVYSIFYNIANTRLFQEGDTTVQQLSANIYVLVSVVMLFAFSVTILSAIVNPDLLSDKKKGVAAIFKRSIIGLVLIVVIPFAFDEMYKIQENVMDNNLIEKIIVGSDFQCREGEEGECEKGGNGGQVIAGNLISSVLYPIDNEVEISEDLNESYSDMVRKDIKNIGIIAKNINITTDGDTKNWGKFDDDNYAFQFDGLIAIVAGIATCYILLLYAIDMAVRVFKLTFLELTAPISIVAYMASGEKVLNSWGKEVMKTFLDVFVRIAAMAIYLFFISSLASYLNTVDKGNHDWSFTLKALLIVGMLIFVKQLPDYVNKVFGTDIKLKGGISGRLGEMAVVGKQAQDAWGKVKNVAKATPLIAGSAAVGAATGLTSRIGNAIGQTKFGTAVNSSPFVQKVRGVGQKVSNVGEKAVDKVKNAKSSLAAVSKETNPFKAYDAFKYSEGSMGSVRKEEKQWERNEKAKADAKENLARTINKSTGSTILDNDGNVTNAALATVSAFKSMINSMKEIATEQQKKALTSYNEKQHDLMVAQKDNQVINQIRNAIENKMNSSTGDQKSDLANILSNLDLGMYKNRTQLETDLGYALLHDSSGVQFNNNISNSLNEMSGGAATINSIDSYSKEVDNKQEAFSRAESTLNDVIDKATSDQKVIMKEARTTSKKMNEANIK